mmetsp:Transcript_26026/g.51889  ORF Transcript_26026/g.51889 Transcript_26026/m.51889 type:complete len:86 (+) Transcript_26026:590-847(+)
MGLQPQMMYQNAWNPPVTSKNEGSLNEILPHHFNSTIFQVRFYIVSSCMLQYFTNLYCNSFTTGVYKGKTVFLSIRTVYSARVIP